MPAKNYFLLFVSISLIFILSFYITSGSTIKNPFFSEIFKNSLNKNKELAEINVATPTGTVKIDLDIPVADRIIEINGTKTFKVYASQVPTGGINTNALAFAINVPVGSVSTTDANFKFSTPLLDSAEVKYKNFDATTKRLEVLIASQDPFTLTQGDVIVTFVYTAPSTVQNVVLSQYTNNASIPSLIDVGGNELLNSASLASVSLSVVLPNASPTAPVVSATPSTSISLGESFNLSATSTDSDGTISKIEFFSKVGTVLTSIGSDTSAPFSIVWTPASAGTFSIVAKSTDNDNAVSVESVSSVILTVKPVLQAPVINPTSNDYYLKGTAITLTNPVSGVTYKYCVEKYNETACSLANATNIDPLTISKNMRIWVIAQKAGYTDSVPSTAIFKLAGDIDLSDTFTITGDVIPVVKKFISNSATPLNQLDMDENGAFNLKDIIVLLSRFLGK